MSSMPAIEPYETIQNFESKDITPQWQRDQEHTRTMRLSTSRKSPAKLANTSQLWSLESRSSFKLARDLIVKLSSLEIVYLLSLNDN
jgi:hypothetical protein